MISNICKIFLYTEKLLSVLYSVCTRLTYTITPYCMEQLYVICVYNDFRAGGRW